MRTLKRKATVLLFLLLIALSACAPGLGTMGDPTPSYPHEQPIGIDQVARP